MDEIGHWGQKQAHYSGPGGAVDINSDVRDVMKSVGEMMTTQVLTTLSPPSAGCHNKARFMC